MGSSSQEDGPRCVLMTSHRPKPSEWFPRYRYPFVQQGQLCLLEAALQTFLSAEH